MSTTFVGALTVGGAVPGVHAGIAVSSADINARVASLEAWAPVPAMPMLAQLELAKQIVASIERLLALGFDAPSFSVDLQVAAIAAQLSLLQGQLSVLASLNGLFAQAGVYAYAYDGAGSAMGAEFTSELALGLPGGSGGAQHINALVLATYVGAAWSAMSSVFKVAP